MKMNMRKVIRMAAALSIAAFIVGFAFGAKAQTSGDVQSKKSLMELGEKYYRAKEYEEAIKQWDKALLMDPNDVNLKKNIARAQKESEKKKKEQARLDIRASDKEEQARKRAEREERKRSRWQKDVGLIGVTEVAPGTPTVLRLNDCVKIAIANNPGLTVAKKSVKLSEMRLWESRRNLLPTAKMVWEETNGRVNGRRYYGKKEYIEGQGSVFHGGEIFYTMKQAEVNQEIVKRDYDRLKNELVLQVKKAFYSLVKSQENLKLQVALNQDVDKIAEIVKKGAESGVISKIEALNVASKTNQAHFQLVSAQGDVEVAELILKQAMNVDPKESITVNQKFKFTKFDVDYEKVLRAAFMNRPEIQINTMSIEYYKYGKDISKAKFWPKVDFMGSWGLAKEEYISMDNQGQIINGQVVTDADEKMAPQWYAGLKASMPLGGNTVEVSQTHEHWVPVVSAYQGTEAITRTVKVNLLDALRYDSDKQSAEVDLSRARQEFEKVKQDITLEVKEQCFNYEKSIVQEDTALKKVEYQGKDLEFMKFRRGMDEALDSDVIESMMKLAQEQFGYAQTISDYCSAIASINKAIGVDDYFKIEEETGEAIKK